MTRDELTKIILPVCERYNGLCMDVAWERRRIAQAIAKAILPNLYDPMLEVRAHAGSE